MATALVLGGASCLWDDLRSLGPFVGPVVATNEAGAHYPHRVDHWATLHPEKLGAWAAERRAWGGNTDFVAWTTAFPGWDKGSSGLHAVAVALLGLGCKRVVLCGVPMSTEPHFFDATPWGKADVHWPAWLERLEEMEGRVFSMGGRTRELLGAPA